MANYTAADVKVLRERTGAGMLDCKKALDESNGDIEKAIEFLRIKGLKGVAKREGRATSEGLVAAKAVDGAAFTIELACETDFVAKNDKFIALSAQVLDAVVAAGASDAAEGLAAAAGDATVADLITNEAAILGEKVELRKVVKVTGDAFEIYLHKTSKDLPPQLAVVVGYTGSDAEAARGVAQHIAFADPHFLTRDEIPEEVVAKERQIAEDTAKEEGKPEAALPKIIEGRLTGFFKQEALLEQPYAKDSKITVAKVVEDAGITVSGFSRLKVGA